MKFKTQREKIAFRIGCAVGNKKQAKKTNSPKPQNIKNKPINIIPYDLGKAKCDYAELLKSRDFEQGKTLRSDKYYHDKAWTALNMDELLKKRGFVFTSVNPKNKY